MRRSANGFPVDAVGNPRLRVEFLADRGPRIVGVYLDGSDENQFAESPQRAIATPFGDYALHGGHRLWHAPERFPDTCLPDDDGLVIERLVDGVRLHEPRRARAVVRKTIELHLDPQAPRVRVQHTIVNTGARPLELAPWAITQLPMGGIMLLPQYSGKRDPDGLWPNRNLVYWPCTPRTDARLDESPDWVFVRGTAGLPPFKIGYLNSCGWAGYYRSGTLYVKRTEHQPGQRYPDLECNTEVYACDAYVELETLAPLAVLQPGQSATHTEIWEFYTGLAPLSTPSDATALARALADLSC